MTNRGMKSFVLELGALLVVAALFAAGAVRAANGPHLTKAKALKLQDEFQHAVVAANTAALDKLMAKDCTFIHGNAMQQTKAQFIGMLKGGAMKVTEFKSSSQQVIPFNGGAIVISVVNWGMLPPRGGANAHPMILPMRISNVWVYTSAGWQMILEQDTSLPQRGGMRRGGRKGPPAASK